MKFSTRTTYGLRAMIQLAKHWGQGSVSLTTIAKDENISRKYLEKLFSELRKAQLVVGEKGSAGGYALSHRPEEISIIDITEALEGELSLFHCVKKAEEITCRQGCKCQVNTVLIKAQNALTEALSSIKLSDLI